jgi:hypothetical protein
MCVMRLNSLIPKIAILVSLLVFGALDFGQDNTSVLIGTVTDQSLAPAPGVLVTLSSMDRVYQTKSSTDGGFRLLAVSRGTYDLEFAAEGFVRQKVSIDLSHEAAQSLAIVLNFSSQPDTNYCGPHPSITYDSLDPNNPRLTGVVRAYENRRPIPGAKVILWRADDARITVTSVADGEGKFKFDDLPAGRYSLRISRIHYLPAEVTSLLAPREDSVYIDIPLRREDRNLIVCQ